MKRCFSVFVALIICLSCLISCGNILPSDKTNDKIDMLPSQEVKVLSINLLVGDSSNSSWDIKGREEIMVPILLSYDPDSIGVQETLGWVVPLDNLLEDYARAGYTGQGVREPRGWYSGNYIYYKKDKYKLIDDGVIWLNDLPDVIDENYRTCSWAILEDKETGFRYVHMNTHLFPTDSKINATEMPVVRDAMARFIMLGLPVFTTGDFNASQGSDNYLIMMNNELIHDSKLIAEESMNMGTYHGMRVQNLEGKNPIDYCFVSHEYMTVHKYEVVSTYVDGKFASDHNGVFVHVTVNSLPDQLQLTPDISPDGITINVVNARPLAVDLSFTQATDCMLIDSYEVAALDKDGNVIIKRTVPSSSARKEIPTTLNCTLTRLSPDTEYTIVVTPLTIIGGRGESAQTVITTPPRD